MPTTGSVNLAIKYASRVRKTVLAQRLIEVSEFAVAISAGDWRNLSFERSAPALSVLSNNRKTSTVANQLPRVILFELHAGDYAAQKTHQSTRFCVDTVLAKPLTPEAVQCFVSSDSARKSPGWTGCFTPRTDTTVRRSGKRIRKWKRGWVQKWASVRVSASTSWRKSFLVYLLFNNFDLGSSLHG